MEYIRTEDAQIYAEIARRLGKIVIVYDQIEIAKDEKFEATLYLAVLQSLLTNCKEHIIQIRKNKKSDNIFGKDFDSVDWGISKNCWIKNTYKEERSLANFITRIRNSVCHPTIIHNTAEFPSTGFTTIENDKGRIRSYKFIDSPDTNNNNVKKFTEKAKIDSYIKNNRKTFPNDISFKEYSNSDGTKGYCLFNNSDKFARISIIELTTLQLRNLVLNLSTYLAQPLQKDWDGKTINKDLIAA
ncbi:MAG: hypothetical protein KKB34_12620 [Bacteroidetes bacterium]|nr:hypothetical protein [Bacteroidota bacterium]